MGDIPVDKAELLSTLLEGILYGFSLLMFGATIWVLHYRRSTRRVSRSMLAVACSLLLCSTIHLVIDIVRVNIGFIAVRDSKGGPIAFFSSVSHWTIVSKTYIYVIQTLIGDGVILYRCFAVWRSKLVMIFPVLLWCATGVTGIASAYSESHLTTENDVFCKILLWWIDAFFGAAFVTNFLTTSLLAYRIWYFDRRATSMRGHSLLRGTLHTIIDAGAIYFIALLALMISFSLQSNSQCVILNMIVPIISITFYMVIIRVGLFNHRRENQQSTTQISSHVEVIDRLPVVDTRSSDGVLVIGQPPPSPTGSMGSVADNERCQTEDDIKPSDTKEVV